MDREIVININNRIASLENPWTIITDNADYIIRFNFDDEWKNHSHKTARFSTGLHYEEKMFSGDVVGVPKFRRTNFVIIGVYSDEIATTGVKIPCIPSILSINGVPTEPSEDVYDQIIGLLNNLVDNGVTDEQIQQAVDSYLSENPVEVEETDPTVPAWAKQPQKPTYTAEEVGAASKEAVKRLSEEKADQFTIGDGLQMSTDRVLSAVGGGGGSESEYELIEQFTLKEAVGEIVRDTEPNGAAYRFKKLYIEVKFPYFEDVQNFGYMYTIIRANNKNVYMPYNTGVQSTTPTQRLGASIICEISGGVSVGYNSVSMDNSIMQGDKMIGNMATYVGDNAYSKITFILQNSFPVDTTFTIRGVRV